ADEDLSGRRSGDDGRAGAGSRGTNGSALRHRTERTDLPAEQARRRDPGGRAVRAGLRRAAWRPTVREAPDAPGRAGRVNGPADSPRAGSTRAIRDPAPAARTRL